MLKKMNINNKLKLLVILFLIIVTTSIISFSLSAKLNNDVEVEPNSDLIYYLDVTYDGIDKYGIESTDSVKSNVISDYIYIEDKLPEGLIFNGFVTSADNTFGAVSRDDPSNICSGSIVDDGLTSSNKRQFIWKDINGDIIDIIEGEWGEFYTADVIGYKPQYSGYTFERWSEPTYDKNLNVIYKALYKQDNTKTINYIVEWFDIEGKTLREGETRLGTIGSVITVSEADKVISGYTFDATNNRNILSTVLSEENNTLKLYFKSSDQTVNNIHSDTIETINEDNVDYTYNYHGLNYNESTRTISFKVKNLQAGCKLTVGIKTITPSSIDNPNTEETELRRDFYNFSVATEKANTKLSNTVHVFMGNENISLYNVNYEYTGDIPTNAPTAPITSHYSSGSKVSIALVPILEGFQFKGWTTNDVTVSNNSFIMPSSNVTFKGSFEKINNYKVTYKIDGLIPDGYITPSEKEYYPDSFVNLDSLKKGDIFNGYRFLGWECDEVIINEDQRFIMPEKDITIIGHFEPVTYKVEYKFYETIMPPNSNSLLPETKEYHPGDKVTLEYPNEIEGYKFLGWYKESNFIMPEEDIIIYGEWKIQNGTFTPSIKKEIINKQDYYRPGDIVSYKITITNNADYAIKNVNLEEKNKNAYFYQDNLSCLMSNITPCQTSYIIKGLHLLEIPRLGSHASIEVFARYIVNENDQGTINNEVEIISALADNYYELNDHEVYKDSEEFKVQSHLKVCKEINSDDYKTFQFHITDYENYDSWINLSNNECTTIYLRPNSYKISEIVPQEYVLKDITLISENKTESISNNDLIDIEFGKNYEIRFKNSYKKKGFYHSDGRVENKVKNEKVKVFVTVEDKSKFYDGQPFQDYSYIISGLEDENIIEVTFPQNTYKNAGIYYIRPIIKWKNPEDESKYELVINTGRLVINRRNIEIESGSSTKEYDGTILTNNTCKIISGEILPSDTYTCHTSGSILNVGQVENEFVFEFDDLTNLENYNIIKINGILTITPEVARYKVIYNDGAGGKVFNDIIFEGLKVEEKTPLVTEDFVREGYTFMGWAPAINPTIDEMDANENNEIIYMATWVKN